MKDTKDLKLLIKFPTRSRPDKFFSVLDRYYHLMQSDNYEFIVSCDIDDVTMNNDQVKERLNSYQNLRYYFSDNKSKIEAVNNDISDVNFDILLLASDDMLPVVHGYDTIIKNVYRSYRDGKCDFVLWLDDGFQGKNLNTLSILGKKFYDEFGYIYHPDYKSLFCDTEFTHVICQTGKYVYLNKVLIKHVQYSIISEEPDELYIVNNKFYEQDLATFNKRRAKNFDL